MKEGVKIYEDRGYLIRQEGKKEDKFEIKTDDRGRYVLDFIIINRKRYLLNEPDIKNIKTCIKNSLFYKDNKIDFSLCIFLEVVDFSNFTFTKQVNFRNTLFLKEAKFTGANFIQNVDFYNCSFTQDVDFGGANFESSASFQEVCFESQVFFRMSSFEMDVYFTYTTFSKGANFMLSKFKDVVGFVKANFIQEVSFIEANFEQADFRYATFNQKSNFMFSNFAHRASFDGAKFKRVASFTKANFMEGANFNYSHFECMLTFQNAKFNNMLTLNGMNDDKNYKYDKFIFDLKNVQVERIDYVDAYIPRADNRETFHILKNVAIKQNDQIKALEFLVKEMKQYKKDLKKAKWIDRFILWFEEKVSYFGTNPLKVIIWMLCLNFIFLIVLFIILDNFQCSRILSYIAHSLNPTASIETIIGKDVKISNESLGVLELINLLKNIFMAVLIYEVIKSFRKYARKL